MTEERLRVPATELALRLAHVQSLLAAGTRGLPELLLLRTEPNWSVRREVVAALGALGDVAVAALCKSLLEERDDETRIAATVDALVASVGDVDSALQGLSSSELAAVLADVAQILGRRQERASIPTLALLAENADDNVAVAAIEGLGRIGGRAAVDVLVRAVESRSFSRTFAAIDVLGKSGDPRAISPLIQLLDNAYHSFEAIRALGRSGNRAAIPALARLLVAPVDAQVRAAAAAIFDARQICAEQLGTTLPIDDALRQSTASTATRRLLHCINGADAAEQVAIVTVLSCLRDAAAVPALMQALEVNAALASVAASVLKELSGGAEAQLADALRSANSARREVLLPALTRSHDAEAAAACLSDAQANVRRLACEALGRIGNQSFVPELFGALADKSPAVAQAAIGAITSLGSSQTRELAIAAATSDVAGVRRAALRILAYTGNPDALSTFETATRDADLGVRAAAIQGLALLESPAALELLLTLASHENASVRANALRALGDTRAELQVGQELTRALTDEDAWVRYYACQSLGKLRIESSLASMAALTNDSAGQVRVAAIEALSHFSSSAAFEALYASAQSSDLDQKRAALIGLGLSAQVAALPVLLAHINSPDAATRLIAISAVSNLDVPETLNALEDALKDADDSVRSAAISFLGNRQGTEATRILCEKLRDKVLQKQALSALLLPQEHRVAGLSLVLQSADDEQATQIANILARLNRPEATAALFEALTFTSASARKAAATTLAALGSKEALTSLRHLAKDDPDPAVRHICQLLLAQ